MYRLCQMTNTGESEREHELEHELTIDKTRAWASTLLGAR